jgi:hypothetical protein
MPLTAKQISALVDAGATDAEIHAMHDSSNVKPAVTTPYLAAQDKANPPTHQPNLNDPPWLAALKETLKIDPSQTANDVGQYLKSLVTGTGKAVTGAVNGAVNTAKHPVDTLMNYVSGPVNQVRDAIQHPQPVGLNMENISKLRDPSIIGEQVGPALATELLPGIAGAIGRGVSHIPDALVQAGSEVGGAVAGGSSPLPFGAYTGMKIGRTISPIVKPIARQVGKLQRSSEMMDQLLGGGDVSSAHPNDLPKEPIDTTPIDLNAPSALDKTTGRISTEVPPGQGFAAPNLFAEHKPMQQSTPGYTTPKTNPNTASAGIVNPDTARMEMLKGVFDGTNLEDVAAGNVKPYVNPDFQAPHSTEYRPYSSTRYGGPTTAGGGEFSNYPRQFETLDAGTTPPSAGNEGDYIRKSWMAEHAPETAEQLKTAAEPRQSVQGLESATEPEVAPEGAGEAESPAARLARILGTPSDDEMKAAIASRQYKS